MKQVSRAEAVRRARVMVVDYLKSTGTVEVGTLTPQERKLVSKIADQIQRADQEARF